MEEYRVDIKVRNNIFLKKIENAGYKSVGNFLRLNGLISKAARLGNIINMKLSPLNRAGNFRPWLNKIAELLNCAPEDLFSDVQLSTVLKDNKRSIAVNEAEMKFMLQTSNQPKLLEEIVDDQIKNKKIKESLSFLTPREQEVIELRFGLKGEEFTLDECANKFNVSRERIRQLEAKALRKLRHPRSSNALREFTEDT